MKGNRSSQPKRGHWSKDKSERGIFQRGTTWYIRFRDQHGKIRAERVGPSKAIALKAYAKRKTEVAERRFFPVSNVSFDEIAKDAIARGRADYERKYPGRKFRPGRYRIVESWFEGRRAASITPQEIAAKLAEACRKPATHNRYRVALSHIYKIAIENHKATENPARLVRLKAENNEIVRYLEPKEEAALRAAIKKLCSEREPELDLALHTGMRWSEQYELRWQDVNLKLGQITIPLAKGGRRQYIQINSRARKALQELRAINPRSDLVCPNTTPKAHRIWWLRCLNEAKFVCPGATPKALKQARFKGFRWHDLRHTFASRLVMSGVDILTVNKLMRHKVLQITMRYAHLSAAHLKQAIERLASVTPGDTAGSEPMEIQPATVQ